MSVFVPVNVENFQTEVLQSSKPCLVEFGATWCAPCKRLEPEIEKLAASLKDQIKMGKVDVDESPDLATQFGIMGVPTVILFVQGEAKGRLSGFQPLNKLENLVSAVI